MLLNYEITHTPSTLSEFIQQLDIIYKDQLTLIPLFNPQQTALWSEDQKTKFAAVFYHLRGHFINFIWYIANFCHDPVIKMLLMSNIHEELGIDNRFSHEHLYERFAVECKADIHDEIVNETHYLSFAKTFNKIHLQWLSEHTNEERLCAFAAYERLDNIDYPHLLAMAQSLNLSPKALAFFNVHVYVEHFDSTLALIQPIWERSPKSLIKAFHFIYQHQYKMWHDLSNTIFLLQ